MVTGKRKENRIGNVNIIKRIRRTINTIIGVVNMKKVDKERARFEMGKMQYDMIC